MKFGGHETFFLRPNWLTKGLVLVEDRERRLGESADAGSKGRAGKGVDGVVWNGEAASDEMGVGRNMSKSIGWWLNRLGLVERNAPGDSLRVSPLGAAFLHGDRYFANNASWWLLHVILALSGREDVFSWFFGKFREPRFAKSGLDGKLVSWIEDNGRRLPSLKTLQRDTAVMLQSYARPVPMPARDPEDHLDCPLRRLGLFVHRTETGNFERRAVTGKIPPAAVAMALSLLLDNGTEAESASGRSEESGRSSETGKSKGDVPLGTSGSLPRLARVFGLDLEGASAVIVDAGKQLGSKSLAIRHLPQGNVATVSRLDPHKWVATHFEEAMESSEAARAAHAAPGRKGGNQGATRTFSATPARNRGGRRPANLSEAAKTAKATESARPVKPAKLAKPTKLVKAAKAVKTAKPTKPTKSAKSAAAAKPAKTAKTANPAKLAKDGKARKPGKVARTGSQPESQRGKIAATASSRARARKGEKAA